MAGIPQIGFVAYASQPAWVGETIESGLERLAQQIGKGKYGSWAENEIAGRFLADPILERIEGAKCLVADISSLNFNVTYEVGYAIAKGKRVVLVRNRAHAADELARADLRRVGIFDTLGFREYENGDEFAAILRNIKDFDGLPVPTIVDTTTPVWMLQFPFNTEVQGRLVARLKKARLRFRSFDPSEQARLAANDAIESVANAYGVVIPLATKDMVDARIHNLRAAFSAGLSHGLAKSTLLLQSGDDPVPLDYRDLVQHFRHAKQIDEYVAQLALDVHEGEQHHER